MFLLGKPSCYQITWCLVVLLVYLLSWTIHKFRLAAHTAAQLYYYLDWFLNVFSLYLILDVILILCSVFYFFMPFINRLSYYSLIPHTTRADLLGHLQHHRPCWTQLHTNFSPIPRSISLLIQHAQTFQVTSNSKAHEFNCTQTRSNPSHRVESNIKAN